MGRPLVHVRGQLPWLESGPLFRVATEALPALREMLDQNDFRVIPLDGRRMGSRREAHAELAAAFGFPDYYGRNWDAFNDCMGDFVEAHDGQRVGVLWHHVADAASMAPVTTAEVGWALLETQSGAMPTLGPGTAWSIQMAVFAIGTGEDFDRP